MFYFIDVIYIPMDNIRLPSDDRSQEPIKFDRLLLEPNRLLLMINFSSTNK